MQSATIQPLALALMMTRRQKRLPHAADLRRHPSA
jgi:hypothetical protein